MTTINNLTIEQMRAIVESAPEGATHIAGSAYLKLIGAAWWQGWLPEWNEDANCMVRRWKGENIELMETWGEVLKLNDLRTAIAEHDREFKVGDLVVYRKQCSLIWDGVYRVDAVLADGRVIERDLPTPKEWLSHATPSEIKAGHRIDDTTDHVTVIRNHLSSSTKVIDHG